ncbi:L,D-transpeptidase [Neogemmobacter tilapiae]|uniref:L,D-transpeptidase n=1 Tax=Neogemmobacter tilapiae TaxID=875041 RepID=A0A918WP26_9RHOB|nr:L,D-transpeptidase [Gemmobacter tilapiae]GHC64206.1 L,D-transpeptidase [Gemmobacter tilapiae]
MLDHQFSRRAFLAALGAAGVVTAMPAFGQDFKIPKNIEPRTVKLRDEWPANEILVDPNIYALFWTLPGRKARKYYIGIARDGEYRPGVFRVGDKRENPSWTPTANMIRRHPELYAPYRRGIAGGAPGNPLGSRALYLYSGGGDSRLRIHGTNAPDTIGSRVSAGCVRMVNAHVEELYSFVPMGTRVTLFDFTPDEI